MLLVIEVPIPVGKAALEQGATATVQHGEAVFGDGVVLTDASAALNVVGEMLEQDRAEHGGLDGLLRRAKG